jgi:hypothetical protein
MSGFVGNLSPQQQAALDEVKQKLSKLEGKLAECSKKMLVDDAIILRFLRARKFDVDQSYDMLYNMLKFRLEFQQIGVDCLNPAMCENELKTGKSYYHGHDKEGRPVCYIRARLHDPSQSDVLENQRFTVLMMEYGKSLLRPPGETVTIVFDMNKATLKNIDIKSVQFMVNTLTSYYPESLGKVLIVNYTWIVNGAWKIIRPWLDPVTAAKVLFIKPEELMNYIDADNLPKEYGGKDTFEYNYTAYRSLLTGESNNHKMVSVGPQS